MHHQGDTRCHHKVVCCKCPHSRHASFAASANPPPPLPLLCLHSPSLPLSLPLSNVILGLMASRLRATATAMHAALQALLAATPGARPKRCAACLCFAFLARQAGSWWRSQRKFRARRLPRHSEAAYQAAARLSRLPLEQCTLLVLQVVALLRQPLSLCTRHNTLPSSVLIKGGKRMASARRKRHGTKTSRRMSHYVQEHDGASAAV